MAVLLLVVISPRSMDWEVARVVLALALFTEEGSVALIDLELGSLNCLRDGFLAGLDFTLRDHTLL